MSVEKLEFTKTWLSADDFPTQENSETQVRADMQCLYDEIKNYINNTLTTAVDAAVANAMGKAAGVENALTGNLYIRKDQPHMILVDTPTESDPEGTAEVHGEVGLGNDGKLRINIHEAGVAGLGGLIFNPNPQDGDINKAIQLWENTPNQAAPETYWTFLTNRNVPALAQIMCGAYIGNGEYGTGHESSLPVPIPFTPDIMMLWDSSGAVRMAHPIIPGTTLTYKLDGVTNTGSVIYSDENPNTISWVHADSAANQLNESDVTYYYLVLGRSGV